YWFASGTLSVYLEEAKYRVSERDKRFDRELVEVVNNLYLLEPDRREFRHFKPTLLFNVVAANSLLSGGAASFCKIACVVVQASVYPPPKVVSDQPHFHQALSSLKHRQHGPSK